MPELPELEFLTLPASHVFVSKKLQQCNWAQACEGGLDTAHFSFLHMAVSDAADVTSRLMTQGVLQPPTPCAGCVTTARRASPSPNIRPVWCSARPAAAIPGENLLAHQPVPDAQPRPRPQRLPGRELPWPVLGADRRHVVLDPLLHLEPRPPADRGGAARFSAGSGVHAEVDAHYVPLRRRENDYLIDRAKQKSETYTGIEGVSEQDACIQDSQGLIADRTTEHLGPTDMGVIRFRRLILEAVRALRDGQPPRAVAHPEAYRVRSGGAIAPADVPLAEVMRDAFRPRTWLGAGRSVTGPHSGSLDHRKIRAPGTR